MRDVGVFQAAADAENSVFVDKQIQLPHLFVFDYKLMTALSLTNFSYFELRENVAVMLPLHCVESRFCASSK